MMLRLVRVLVAVLSLLCIFANPATAATPTTVALVESMSGPFANTGESVLRNLVWAAERINARGGATPAMLSPRLEVKVYDSKGQVEEALFALKAAIDGGARVIVQGNSSAIASALIDAINKHNERDPRRRVLYLNYSAVEPALTNELCSFWHFRFDAHANMRMMALMRVLQKDRAVRGVYLIGQDYSFGRSVLAEARRQLAVLRPDVTILGQDLHPIGRVKDFMPYVAKVLASGADVVVTGNWGNDLTLLIRAAKDAGFRGKFYTFYGNALGAPSAIGSAGVGQVLAVAEWLPNNPGADSEAFYRAFRARSPKPADDYVHLRMAMMMEALAAAIAAARTDEPFAVAVQLENASVTMGGQTGRMRAADHQFQQPLVVGEMREQGSEGVPFDVEGSGFGFRVLQQIPLEQTQQSHSCSMMRPER
jgi:branched-chain amino acid transport system substrate-binding protein